MTVAVKNNNKMPLVVPSAVRRLAGFKNGQNVEFRVAGGVVTIYPKQMIDKEEKYFGELMRQTEKEADISLAKAKKLLA